MRTSRRGFFGWLLAITSAWQGRTVTEAVDPRRITGGPIEFAGRTYVFTKDACYEAGGRWRRAVRSRHERAFET